ncbi:hypothetical protein BUE80_DR009191 [Diplocarpon rosae]|nr:hypothetical protein BUE80_DR009191 [Diplocarpon rosae]
MVACTALDPTESAGINWSLRDTSSLNNEALLCSFREAPIHARCLAREAILTKRNSKYQSQEQLFRKPILENCPELFPVPSKITPTILLEHDRIQSHMIDKPLNIMLTNYCRRPSFQQQRRG